MMLKNTSVAGWGGAGGQIAIGAAASIAVGSAILLGGWTACILLIVLTFCSPSFMILAFVCLSYFRIHEAYPFLVALQLPLVFSAASIAAITFALLKSRQAYPTQSNALVVAGILTFLTADIIILGGLSNDAARVPVLIAMIFGAAAFYAWYVALDLMKPIPWGREIRYFVLFFIIVTIGVALSREPSTAFGFWNAVYWKVGAMTLALAWLIRTESDFRSALWALIVSGCLIAIVTWYNWYFSIDLIEGTRVTIGRTLFSTPDDIANAIPGQPIPGSSKLGDPNDLALVLLFPVGLALAAFVRLGFRAPLGWFGMIALALIIPAIVMTQSRGGALGVVAVFGAVGLFYVRSKALLVAAALIGVLGLIVVMGIEGRSSGGLAEIEGGGLDQSSLERIHAWSAAISMTASNPLTGVGPANFTNEYHAHTPVWTGRSLAAHSTWFQIMAETGLPGFAVFMAIIIAIFLTIRRSWVTLKEANANPIYSVFCIGLFAALVGFCTAGTFLSQGYRWPLYLLIGFSAALSCTTRQIAEGNTISTNTTSTNSSPSSASRL